MLAGRLGASFRAMPPPKRRAQDSGTCLSARCDGLGQLQQESTSCSTKAYPSRERCLRSLECDVFAEITWTDFVPLLSERRKSLHCHDGDGSVWSTVMPVCPVVVVVANHSLMLYLQCVDLRPLGRA
eukprot:gnl/TRDRNA2_/TRDRNA2_133272_c0_seq2.p4 gnl/TRDRNA2_/TRDRNA2_133272_c0~~gnl/TRDRNA2_/TRDRNA2_133272_c0_seq2.p4  ORF type:complete len:127 (-),score=3.68 gnl/TRDRNA2_/TRDRNA2_133272_c0_seq2:38-418(-)